MKYGFLVRHNGVYYPSGMDVPEGDTPSTSTNVEPPTPEVNTVANPEPSQGNDDDVDNTSTPVAAPDG